MKIMVTRRRSRAAAWQGCCGKKEQRCWKRLQSASCRRWRAKDFVRRFPRFGNTSGSCFTSPTGVEVFWNALRHYRVDVRSLSHLRIAVIGSGTARALEAHGMYADLMPEIYDGEHLGAALGEVLLDEHVLIPRAKTGNPELIREIRKRSAAVIEDLPIYDTHYEAYAFIDYREEFEHGKTDYVMFTSASTVRGFVQAAEGLDFSKVQALCIGKETKAEADRYGMHTFQGERSRHWRQW